MIQGAFQHRSGRIIAFGRAVLAVFFLLIIWADRAQPAISPPQTYAFLGAYAVASLTYLAFTWNNWWLDTRLAAPAHVIDLLVFTSLNYVTQGYTSPFFTYFVFLLLSASIRWGWRHTAATAVAIIVLYLVEGVSASTWGTEDFDLSRFLIRSSYLVVLSSMILLWFASNQRSPRPSLTPRSAESGVAERQTMERLLSYAGEWFNSPRAVLAWSEREEPWTWVAELDQAGYSQARFEPDEFDPLLSEEAGPDVLIFDQARGRILRRFGRRTRGLRVETPVHAGFAQRYAIQRGLRIPIRSSQVDGELFLLGVVGLCADDLELADEAREEIVASIEHGELVHAIDEAAAIRTRLSFARDIHDSVVQFLAGLTFRMEGLRNAVRAGRDVEGEIDDLQRELSREQQDLRRFIARLRAERSATAWTDLPASLRGLTDRMASQWGIDCRIKAEPARIDVPASLERNVGQILREAVANAVRHGGASAVETRLARHDGTLDIAIADNGRGFDAQGEFGEEELEARSLGPRSLRERVHALGGSLRLASSRQGARLDIRLPVPEDQP